MSKKGKGPKKVSYVVQKLVIENIMPNGSEKSCENEI